MSLLEGKWLLRRTRLTAHSNDNVLIIDIRAQAQETSLSAARRFAAFSERRPHPIAPAFLHRYFLFSRSSLSGWCCRCHGTEARSQTRARRAPHDSGLKLTNRPPGF